MPRRCTIRVPASRPWSGPLIFQLAAQSFADAQVHLESVSGQLRTTLAGLVGAAGDDGPAGTFTTGHLPAADTAFGGFVRPTSAADPVGVVARLLHSEFERIGSGELSATVVPSLLYVDYEPFHEFGLAASAFGWHFREYDTSFAVRSNYPTDDPELALCRRIFEVLSPRPVENDVVVINRAC